MRKSVPVSFQHCLQKYSLIASLFLAFAGEAQSAQYMKCPQDYLARTNGSPCGGWANDSQTHSYPYTMRTRTIWEGETARVTTILTCHFDFAPPPIQPFQDYDTPLCSTLLNSSQMPQKARDSVDYQVNRCGSIIHADHQSVGEAIALVGTPYRLVYFSDRVLGRASDYSMLIPNAGMCNPKSVFGEYGAPGILSGVEGEPSICQGTDVVEVILNNSTISRTEGPSTTEPSFRPFAWNGKDASGNLVPGSAALTVRTTNRDCTGLPAGTPVDQCPSRGSFSSVATLGAWKASFVGLGGWDLDFHHFYDAARKKIYFGFGESRNLTALDVRLSADGTVVKVQNAEAPTHYLVSSKDASEAYLFDLTGRHVETRSTTSGKTLLKFTYVSGLELATIEDSFGNITKVTKVSATERRIVAPRGQVTVLTLNASGWLTSVKDPGGRAHVMTYKSALGLLASFKRPSGRVSNFRYDAEGQLIQDSNNGGASTLLETLASSTFGSTVRMTTAEGRSETYQTQIFPNENGFDRTEWIDGIGQSRVLYSPYSSKEEATITGMQVNEQYGEDPRFSWLSPVTTSQFARSNTSGAAYFSRTSSRLSSPLESDLLTLQSGQEAITLNGNAWLMAYDGTAKTHTLTSPQNRITKLKVNDFDQVTEIKVGGLLPIKIEYDLLGREKRITQGTRSQTVTYNAKGLIATRTDARGKVTSYTYNANGELLTETRPDLKVLRYTYNPDGKLASVTPVGKSVHVFGYDLLGLLQQYLPPTLGGLIPATTYAYNRDGALTKITKPDASVVTFNYYPSGLLNTIETPEGLYMHVYGSGGVLAQKTSPQGVVSTLTTDAGILKGVSTTLGSAYAGNVTFDYENSKLKTVHVLGSSGTEKTITYAYDNDDLVLSAGGMTLKRNGPAGAVSGATLGIVTEAYGYDPSYGEMSSHLATVKIGTATQELLSETYTRDALGRIDTKIERASGLTKLYKYTYDDLGRLTDVTINGVLTRHYGYDDNHNRILLQEGTKITRATYDDQDRLTNYGATTYIPSPAGESKTRTASNGLTTDYTYDSFGALLSVAQQIKNADGSIGTKTFEYVNDPSGQRLIKKINGVVSKRFVWSGSQLLAELNASGAVLSHFIYASRSHVPDAMVKSGVTYKIVTDHLGSVRFIVNQANGTVAQALTYDEFGRVLSDTKPGFQPLGFAGGLYDQDTKLVRFGAREYDPEIGRWTSKDPILFAGGDTNLYGYVLQDPVNLVDPSGNFAILLPAVPAILEGIAFVGSAVGAGWGISELINLFQNKSKMPTVGIPGSSQVIPDANGGKLKERVYGEDGRVIKDIDWDHDHGAGIPHVHDWTWPNGAPSRGPGRPPGKGECK